MKSPNTEVHQFNVRRGVPFLSSALLISVICLLCSFLLMLWPLPSTQEFALASTERSIARGFHAAETTPEGRGFRWTDGSSRLHLSAQGSGEHVLQLTAIAPPPIKVPAPVELVLNKQSFAFFTITREIRHYQLLVPTHGIWFDDNIVEILSPSYPSLNETTPRDLGIVLFEAEWKSLRHSVWLTLLQVLVITIAVSTLLFLLTQLGFSFILRATITIVFAVLLLGIGHIDPRFAIRWYALLLTLFTSGLLFLATIFMGTLASEYVVLPSKNWLLKVGIRVLLVIGLLAGTTVFLILAFSWHVSVLPLLVAVSLIVLLVGIPLTRQVFTGIELVPSFIIESFKSNIFLAVLSIILIVAFFTIYLNCSYAYCPFTKYSHPPIHSDGKGYYAYLPAALIDYDLTMETLMQRTDTNTVGRFPETGLYLAKYSMGVAVMMLPFFLIGHLLTLLTGYPADGFSLFYQLSVGFAGVVYALVGLFLLKRVLQRFFAPWVVVVTLLGVLLGTNMFNYASFDSTFSHAFSFCLFALLLYILPHWYQSMSYRNSLLLAAVCGLIILVRVPNGLVWLFVPFFGITGLENLKERVRFFWQHKILLLLMVLTIFLIQLPQILYWHFITGHWLVNSYQSEGFRFWQEPHLWGVLFGEQRGLFVWSPVLLLCIPGLWFMANKVQPFFLPTIIYLPILLYLTASWHDQGLGATYGQRLWIDSLSILALPLASLLAALRWKTERIAVTVLVGLLIMLSLTQTFRYWQGEIDPYKPTWEEYFSVVEKRN